jgi:hypothetical protein
MAVSVKAGVFRRLRTAWNTSLNQVMARNTRRGRTVASGRGLAGFWQL